MISCFPSVYENELVYSILARYYQKTGYVAYRDVAEDLYVNPHTRPDTEFINRLTSNAVEMLCRKKSMEQIVLEHTMYPLYARFLPLERKEEAFNWMVEMRGKCCDVVPMKVTNGKIRYLRYCPLCVKEHRKKYGETYWTRVHQISDIRICLQHNVFLLDSIVEMTGNISPNLVSAEMVIPEDNEIQVNVNEKEYEISKLIQDIFLSPFDFTNATPVGKFLNSKLVGTPYLSKRGGARNVSLLYEDITDYCKDLEMHKIEKKWYLGKIFSGKRVYLSEVALLAHFLDIPKEELLNPKIEVENLTEQFDEQIVHLHRTGLNYRQISQKLDISYDVAKAIGRGVYNKYSYERKKMGKKQSHMDWDIIDDIMQTDVQNAVESIHGIEDARPQRVTIHRVADVLGIPNTRFKKMPKCVAIIKAKEESYEEFFARETIWAAKTILSTGRELNYTAITRLINIRRKQFENCKVHLDKYTDKELADKIRIL